MKVTLFRDLPSERWPSMERYADALAAALPRASSTLVLRPYVSRLPREPRGPWRSAATQAWRTLVYPLAARTQQGELNHIVDHSYAHLVHALDARRTIVTCHDLAPLAMPAQHAGRGLSMRLWRWSWAGLHKAAHIICVSRFTAQELMRLGDFDEARLSVAPLGVAGTFRPLSNHDLLSALRARYALPAQAPLLLHVGSCAARKNLEGLLSALARLRETRRDFHCVQVGGAFTAAQREQIARAGLQTHITQVAHAPEAEMPAWYNLADLFVFPSLYEGFGLPVLEAMACGTPVICSRAGSLPEVAGDAAYLVNPSDPEHLTRALNTLLDDHAQRELLTHRGLARARQFTWQRTAEQVIAVYQRVWRARA